MVRFAQTYARVTCRVIDHHVGIGSRGDHSLAGVHPEHAGRRGGTHLHPPLQADAPVDHTLIHEVEPVFDTADSVGDLGEVGDSEFLLVHHAERAVVGGDTGHIAGPDELPQLVLMTLGAGAQRGRTHPLRALEASGAELFLQREIQVLRACLGEHVGALATCGRDLLEGLPGGHVHHVERRSGDIGEHDGPVRGLFLELPRA